MCERCTNSNLSGEEKREREVNSEMKKSEADSIDEEMLETSLKKKKKIRVNEAWEGGYQR